MNNLLLTNEPLVKDIEKQITDYFHLNSGTEVLPYMVWDALKPVIQGTYISKVAYLK